MSELKIEYLIQFDNKTEICNSEKSFKNLLCLNEKLTIEGDKIRYDDLSFDYKIKLNQKEKERFFELVIIYKDEDVKTRFTSCQDFISEINKAIYFSGKARVYTLWDDLSFNYSKQAYPLIYEVENLMRKLITKFMVINVGIHWSKTDLTELIRNQAKNGTDDTIILYGLDFKHLSDVLLKSELPKSDRKDIEQVYKKIMKARNSSELDINELKNIVPQSNWQKYFSTLIQYESAELEKNWENLYELRCKVAHNNFINKGDYQEITRLTNELKSKLQDAIEKLDDVEVAEEDKEDIIENVSEDILNQVNSNNSSSESISIRMANAVNIEKLLDFAAISIGQSESLISRLVGGMGEGVVDSQLSRLARQVVGVDKAQTEKIITALTRGSDIYLGLKPGIREVRTPVNDEATTKGINTDNERINEAEDAGQNSSEDKARE